MAENKAKNTEKAKNNKFKNNNEKTRTGRADVRIDTIVS